MTVARVGLSRQSVEAIYPRNTFEADAAANSVARATVFRGLRLEKTTRADEPVRIVPATRHVGGKEATPGTLFMCPYMGHAYGVFSLARGVHGPIVEKADPFARHPEEYDEFIGRVISAADKLLRRRAPARRPQSES